MNAQNDGTVKHYQHGPIPFIFGSLFKHKGGVVMVGKMISEPVINRVPVETVACRIGPFQSPSSPLPPQLVVRAINIVYV